MATVSTFTQKTTVSILVRGIFRWAMGVLTRKSQGFRASRCLYLHWCSARLTSRPFTLRYTSRHPSCPRNENVRAGPAVS
jgi:hypothetical protein